MEKRDVKAETKNNYGSSCGQFIVPSISNKAQETNLNNKSSGGHDGTYINRSTTVGIFNSLQASKIQDKCNIK